MALHQLPTMMFWDFQYVTGGKWMQKESRQLIGGVDERAGSRCNQRVGILRQSIKQLHIDIARHQISNQLNLSVMV